MFEITLSEDLRARLDALKDIALNQWRENVVSLFSPKSMPRLHFHVQPCPIVNTNTFYTLSTGLILQGRKRSTTDGQNIEYGKGTSCTTAADSPASYEVTCASDSKPFVSISVELDPQVLTDLLATCPEIAAKHKGVVVGHSVHAFTAMPATVDIVEAFERLLRLVYQNPEQLSTRGPIIERELTYVLLMSPQGAALSQFFSQNTPANRINRAIQWIRQNTGKPLDIEALAEMDTIIDVSHLNDGGFYDIYESGVRMVATHSNSRALCPHPRNITDDMAMKIADRGGIIGMNICPAFLYPYPEGTKEEDCRSRIEDMVAHIMHFYSIAGEDVIAIGSDLDGTGGALELASVLDYEKLFDPLKKAGLGERQIEKFYYLNGLRMFK